MLYQEGCRKIPVQWLRTRRATPGYHVHGTTMEGLTKTILVVSAHAADWNRQSHRGLRQRGSGLRRGAGPARRRHCGRRGWRGRGTSPGCRGSGPPGRRTPRQGRALARPAEIRGAGPGYLWAARQARRTRRAVGGIGGEPGVKSPATGSIGFGEAEFHLAKGQGDRRSSFSRVRGGSKLGEVLNASPGKTER